MKHTITMLLSVAVIAAFVLSEYVQWVAQEEFKADVRHFMEQGRRFTEEDGMELCMLSQSKSECERIIYRDIQSR